MSDNMPDVIYVPQLDGTKHITNIWFDEPHKSFTCTKFSRADQQEPERCCQGCGRMESDGVPPPPALSCCPERKLITVREYIRQGHEANADFIKKWRPKHDNPDDIVWFDAFVNRHVDELLQSKGDWDRIKSIRSALID